MSSKLIGQPRCRGSDAETPACVPGPFVRKFRDKFTKQMEALCGVNGEAIVKLCQVSLIFLDITCLATIRYDMIEEFNLDWKAECNHFNLARN